MTRHLPPPYLRVVANPVVDAVSSPPPSLHDSAPAGITVPMQSTADATRRLVDAAMDGLLDSALDHGLASAFGFATCDAIAKIIERDLEAWVTQWIVTFEPRLPANNPHMAGTDGRE